MTDEVQARRELIAQLFGAFGRTPKEHEYTGYEASLKLMPTPSLARVITTWLEQIGDATDPEDLRVPTAAKLWALRRKLKKLPSAPPLELHGAPPQKQDAWVSAANTLLLNYLTLGLVQKAIYGQKPTRDAGRYSPPSHTAVMVKWKNAWARDMREDRDLYEGKLDGKAEWLACMAKAEAEIDALILAERAAA